MRETVVNAIAEFLSEPLPETASPTAFGRLQIQLETASKRWPHATGIEIDAGVHRAIRLARSKADRAVAKADALEAFGRAAAND